MAGLLMLLLRWRQGKELELGFELEEAHFIFINIIIGRKKKKKKYYYIILYILLVELLLELKWKLSLFGELLLCLVQLR